jgi:hypothetical protein
LLPFQLTKDGFTDPLRRPVYHGVEIHIHIFDADLARPKNANHDPEALDDGPVRAVDSFHVSHHPSDPSAKAPQGETESALNGSSHFFANPEIVATNF